MLENVIAIIMAGGQGSRLWPLTERRAKPAVPIAGKFRLIDISFSNCLHSDIKKMFVLTQFASESLHRHINQTYTFPTWSRGFAQILAAQQTNANKDWYQGTADAVRQNLTYLKQPNIDSYLILSGDHLYRMDYRDMLKTHNESGADVTVSVLPVPRDRADQFGVLKTDDTGRIVDFYEKPQTEDVLNAFAPNQGWLAEQGSRIDGDLMLASMGIYIFSRNALFEILQKSNESDFGKGIFPRAIEEYKVQAHYFDSYWEDIGTIRAFYDAMIALTDVAPEFDFYDDQRPVFTHARFLPGARMNNCRITESIVCDAARMKDATVHKSIVGIRSILRTGSKLDHVIMMGADYAENDQEERVRANNGTPPLGIGENSIVERAIIDKNARIGRNVRLLQEGRPDDATTDTYAIRDGVLIIPKDAVLPDNFKI